jgi:hypothetical protein
VALDFRAAVQSLLTHRPTHVPPTSARRRRLRLLFLIGELYMPIPTPGDWTPDALPR